MNRGKRVQFVVVFSAVILLVSGFFYFKRSPTLPINSQPRAIAIVSKVRRQPRPLPQDIVQIQQELGSADASVRDDAIAALHQLGEDKPKVLAAHLLSFIDSLKALAAYSDIDTLSLKAILSRPNDTVTVCRLQRARVEALLAAGENEKALREAKSYYNVATLSQTGDAIGLLSAALGKVRPRDVEAFKEQQRIGARTREATASIDSVLRTIKVDTSSSPWASGTTGAATSFDQLMARANLLLLWDRPTMGRAAFISACKSRGKKTGDKGFYDAVEGVARAVRDEQTVVGPANAMILTLMLDDDERTFFPTDIWQTGELSIAGHHVALSELSTSNQSISVASGQENDESSLLADDGESSQVTPTNTLYDLSDPLLAAILASGNVEIVDWLQRWHDDYLSKTAFLTSVHDRSRLRIILQQTKSPCVLLFYIGHAFQFLTRDYDTAALFYEAGANNLNVELKRGTSQQRSIIVRSIKDHVGGFRRVLWTVASRDDSAVDALYKLYSSYIQWAPLDNGSLQKQAIAFTASAAECLNYQNRSDETIAILNSLTNEQIERGGLRSSVDFEYGKALCANRQYAEAVLRFRSATKSPRYAEAASQYLITCSASAGDSATAQIAYADWVSTRNPTLEQKSAMLALVKKLSAIRR